jgi:tRNA dimethylallyltransferase
VNTINENYNLVVVLGPTATGKTRFAAELASRIEGEIISADSRQVYRRMNLGTGKDYVDYLVNGKIIPCHLIDIHDPGYKYNVYEYQQDFTRAFKAIHHRSHVPVLCGGSGLYIEAVTKGYRLIAVPENPVLRSELSEKSMEELENMLLSFRKLHNKTDTDTKKRAIRAIEIEAYYARKGEIGLTFSEIQPIYIGIKSDRFVRRQRITERLHIRLEQGMVKEVQDLLNVGISPDDLLYYGLEYKYITRYLLGELDYDTMITRLNTAIHQFAKRQMTWFRKMEREGIPIFWIDAQLPAEEKIELALKHLSA